MKKIAFLLCLIIVSFSCSEDDSSSEQEQNQNVPLITILPITEIAGDFAKTGADLIENNGFPITRKGICYSTEPNPTVENFITEEGDGTSGFESELLEVDFETTYYVRAYAENSEGVGYSEELSFTTNTICFANLFDGGLTLTTQTEVNDFAANYCGVTLSLLIDESSATSDFITDLTPLLTIRQIGELRISSTSSLQSLDGLENIESVNSIDLSWNANLENIDGLSRILEVDFLKIFQAPKLRNLGALQLTKADINIGDNELLENIDALSSLQESQELIIVNNPALTNFCGLTTLIQSNGFSGNYIVSNNAFNPTQQDIIDGNCSQ